MNHWQRVVPFRDTNRKEDRGDPLRNDEKKGMMSARIEEVEALNITNRPLSLIMNDKDNTISTNQEDIHEIEGIKQEPPDDVASSLLTTNNNNLSNKQEAEDMSDIDEEDDDEDPTINLYHPLSVGEYIANLCKCSIHSGRISDLSRPSDRLRAFRSPSPSDLIVSRGPPTGQPGLDRLTAAGFPLVPNSMFSHSIMYMSHYIPGLTHQHHGHHPSIGPSTAPSSSNAGLNLSALASSADERRKRNRTFIDPVTEVPRLEQWFSLNTHPSHNLILKYTEELNRMPYRQKFPRLEPKNVQFWFKNRRAKCKRLKMSLFETGPSGIQANLQPLPYHQQPPSEDSLRNRD
uniref:(California timema) hypothetical protein n=1 Tax=Timema californicum TaxID=61474 RepID=A0A7R9J4M3_TIMCA|nr:unnamed protein product [Timema californicum]